MKWPNDKKIQIPRRHNSIVNSELIGSDEKVELTPQVAEWDIAVPNRPRGNQNPLPVVVLDFDAPVAIADSNLPDGHGGNENEIIAGDQKLAFVVEATGGFQVWREVEVGEFELDANRVAGIMVKPKSKAKNAVMDIQEINLVPQ